MLPVHTSSQGRLDDLEHGGRTDSKPGMKLSRKVLKWIQSFMKEQDSRNLFGFLIINLSFAFVELLYGMWTNSLGLISDSFHMLFDCTALLAGLVATVITRWGANERFSYGYVRAEIIAGFVNALFLLFVGFFIFAEAVERAFEPPEVKHDRLLLISVLGFLVNLIGIFVFHHGGGGHHHHGDCSHGSGHSHHHSDENHQHSNHSHNDHDNHSHHQSNHSHSHGSHILHGVFLHILADTLGSVGVIISSILIERFGWMIADPLCSIAISLLILASVYPLMNDTVGILMMRTPPSIEHYLAGAYQKISQLPGVLGVRDPHFWTLSSGSLHGCVRVEVGPDCNASTTLASTKGIFRQIGVNNVAVEVATF